MDIKKYINENLRKINNIYYLEIWNGSNSTTATVVVAVAEVEVAAMAVAMAAALKTV